MLELKGAALIKGRNLFKFRRLLEEMQEIDLRN